MSRQIDVALGILTEVRPGIDGKSQRARVGRQHILITRRPASTVYGGYWEFPGGKVEPAESAVQALVREMEEELGIQVLPGRPLGVVIHTYPHAKVRLHPYFCTRRGGEIQNLGVSEHRWVLPGEIKSFQFPEANLPVIEEMLDFLSRQAGTKGGIEAGCP